MGYDTTAIEKRDEVRKRISQAIEALSEIVVDQCWGHDEFVKEYQETLTSCFIELLAMRQRLG